MLCKGLLFWKKTTYILVDMYIYGTFLWIFYLYSMSAMNIAYISTFTNFYNIKILSEFNFLNDENIDKLYNIFKVFKKYNKIFGGQFVCMSSKMKAPWVSNYKVLENKLTYNIMIGIQCVTDIHFNYKLKYNVFNNNFFNFRKKNYSNIPSNSGSNDVCAEYQYIEDGSEYSLEVVFENAGFKFIEYFPTKFAKIRSWSNISSFDFIHTFEYNLLKFITNSKSGMFFFYTFDGKYLVKSLKKSEFEFFVNIFEEYFQFLRAEPNSFVNKFFGMYRILNVENAGNDANSDLSFIIMESIFYSDLDITQIYDLKGSTKGRELSQKEKQSMKVPGILFVRFCFLLFVCMFLCVCVCIGLYVSFERFGFLEQWNTYQCWWNC